MDNRDHIRSMHLRDEAWAVVSEAPAREAIERLAEGTFTPDDLFFVPPMARLVAAELRFRARLVAGQEGPAL